MGQDNAAESERNSVMRYYYPEDVIVTTVDGVRLARTGFTAAIRDDGLVHITSELPVRFTQADVHKIEALYFQIWENARMRIRDEAWNAWLQKNNPAVWAEHVASEEYVKEVGMAKASVYEFRRRQTGKA